MKKLILVYCALLASSAVQAMSWQELKTEIDSVESGQPGNQEIIMRFSEMVQMLVVYSKAVHELHPDAKITCPTEGSSMHIDEIVSMVRKQARETQVDKNASVQALMLESFKERFPCH